MKLSRSFFARIEHPSRRAVILSSVIAVLIAVAGYVLWSQQIWAQYQPSYVQWRQDIHAEVDNAVVLPAETDDERQVVVTRYAGIAKHIEDTEQAVCQISPVVAWQTNIVDSLADVQADCQSMVADMGGFKTRLQAVVTYLRDDQVLTAIMTAAALPGELADDEWPGQVQAWEKAIQSTKALSVSDDFQPVRILAIEKMTAVKTAWEDVVAAHNAKNKKQYLAAQATLASSYDGLHEIAASTEKVMSDVSARLQSSSSVVFGDRQ